MSVDPCPEKNSGSRMIAPKSAIDAAAITSWPKSDPISSESLSTGHDHAERRRNEDDGDEQRRADEAARVQRQADDDSERERQHEPERGQLQHAAAQTLNVDLEPGEEEQEREPDQREDLDREVHRDPAQAGGSDDDEAIRGDARLCYAMVVATMSQGRHADALPWIEAMTEADLPGAFGDGTTSVEAGVAVAECMLFGNTGDIGAAAPACRRAVDIETEGAPWHAIAMIMEGHAHLWLGDYEAAVPLMERGGAWQGRPAC